MNEPFFLIESDFNLFIQESIKSNVTRNNTSILKTAEQMAIEEMESYLSIRYDTSKIFILITDWRDTVSYSEGDFVLYNSKIFRSLVNENILSSEDNLDSWIIDDPRNSLIVRYMCEITLYLAHQAINPNQIPKLRIDNYDLAIKWLSKVAEGKLNPKLPKIEPQDNSKDYIVSGSLSKRTYHF